MDRLRGVANALVWALAVAIAWLERRDGGARSPGGVTAPREAAPASGPAVAAAAPAAPPAPRPPSPPRAPAAPGPAPEAAQAPPAQAPQPPAAAPPTAGAADAGGPAGPADAGPAEGPSDARPEMTEADPSRAGEATADAAPEPDPAAPPADGVPMEDVPAEEEPAVPASNEGGEGGGGGGGGEGGEEDERPLPPPAAAPDVLEVARSAAGRDAGTGAGGPTTSEVPAGAVFGDGTRVCPDDHPIKGNATSRIYHSPGRPSYEATIAEYCFESAEAAEAAGFRAPRSGGAGRPAG